MATEKEKDEKEGAEVAAPKPKSKKGLFIGLAVGGVVLLAAGIAVPVVLMSKPEIKEDETELPSGAVEAEPAVIQPAGFDDEDEADEDLEPLGAFFALETFVVNLSQGGYLRATIQLEFTDLDVPKRFLTRIVPVRDSIIFLLGRTTAQDLSSTDGKRNLQIAIRDLVNELLRKEQVKQVYFTQFVVQ